MIGKTFKFKEQTYPKVRNNYYSLNRGGGGTFLFPEKSENWASTKHKFLKIV